MNNGYVAMALAAVACAPPAVALESVLLERCLQSGMHGCGAVVDGMMSYVKGDREDAQANFSSVGPLNWTEDVETFALSVRLLRHSQRFYSYAKPLNESVVLLEREARNTPLPADVSVVRLPSSADGTAREEQTPPVSSHALTRTITAETDPRQAIDGVFTPGDKHVPFECERALRGRSSCALVAKGPFYLTDLVSLGTNCSGQYAAVVSGGTARWVAEGAPHFAGANLLIRENELLILGSHAVTSQLPGSEAAPTCSLLWSGYRPYPSAVDADAQ